jgi:hypothetical protein
MLLFSEEQATESWGPSNKQMPIRKCGASVFKGVCTVYGNVIEGVGVWLYYLSSKRLGHLIYVAENVK